MTFDEAVAYALTLGGEKATHYGQPAVKVNGHAILNTGREAGSFCLQVDEDTKLVLIETAPATFWQTPHYDGYPAVLVREDGGDRDRIVALIDRAGERARARKPPRPRAQRKA